MLVGALPFLPNRLGELVIPRAVHGTALNAIADVPAQEFGFAWQRQEIPSPGDYVHGVCQVLAALRDGTLRKVVLARSVRLTASERVDVGRLVRRLAVRDPLAYTFAARLPEPTPGAGHPILVGASPELLVSKHGRTVVSHPLAGSAPRSDDPFEDRRQAETLMCSDKNAREHAVVVDAIVTTLRQFCPQLTVPPRPALVGTATMWHLGTRISAQLADPKVSSLDLALALHPTPAVCGWPTGRARSVIAELEPFDRGCYAGAAGWCDAAGNGEWAVALRCAEVHDRTVRVFAGAGIVPGSDPEAELAETTQKLRTLYRALGLES
jgi:isochorismate synthase